MNYSIVWGGDTVTVIYSGSISNNDIKHAHFTLNGDERFYEAKSLVLDISNCTMEQVSVDELIEVIGTDLGASKFLTSLKVARVAVEDENREKASRYISRCISLGYPWRFRLFDSIEAAQLWITDPAKANQAAPGAG